MQGINFPKGINKVTSPMKTSVTKYFEEESNIKDGLLPKINGQLTVTVGLLSHHNYGTEVTMF